LVVLPWLWPGWFAVYDLVLLPDMPLTDAALGVDAAQPRNVPSDTVTASLSQLPFTGVAYRVLLVGILVAAGLGARWCLREAWWPAGAAAGVAYVWTPFVFERFAIGQWALLAGYAALPWIIASVSRGAGVRSAGGAAIVLGCLGGISAALLIAVGLTVALSVNRRAPATWLAWGTLWLLSCAPWLIVGLARADAYSDPAGFEAFAPRADGPFTTVGSLLTLGGFWSSRSDPPGRELLLPALLSLSLVVAAIWAAVRHARDDDTRPGDPVRTALWVGAVGLALALTASVPSVRDALAAVNLPGVGILRDGQKWIGLWALPVALGLGCVVLQGARKGLVTGRVVAVLALAAPLAVTPALAWGLNGRVVPVAAPVADWDAALAEVRADPGPILSLPWSAYRSTTWSDTTVLDPLTKIAPVPVIWDDGVRVGAARVSGESEVAAQVTQALSRGQSPAAVAQGVGARWIWLDASGFDSVQSAGLETAEPVVVNATVRLYRVVPEAVYPGPVVGRWVAWLGLATWASTTSWLVLSSVLRRVRQGRADAAFR
jgi:hypothetical protein